MIKVRREDTPAFYFRADPEPIDRHTASLTSEGRGKSKDPFPDFVSPFSFFRYGGPNSAKILSDYAIRTALLVVLQEAYDQ